MPTPMAAAQPTQPFSHIPREIAAKLLNVSVRTLDRTIRRGFLRAERFDRNVFIPRPAFERYYEKQAHRVGLPPLSELNVGEEAVEAERASEPAPTASASVAEASPTPTVEFTSHKRDYGDEIKPVAIYKSFYEELKTKYEEQQRRMEGAHYRVGQLEAQLKNMVPLLEVKQERKRFEEAKIRVIQTRRVVETERYNKGIYIALVYILLALQPVFWVMLQR